MKLAGIFFVVFIVLAMALQPEAQVVRRTGRVFRRTGRNFNRRTGLGESKVDFDTMNKNFD